MAIAKVITCDIGARPYAPEGPYGAAGLMPFPSFAPGTVMEGELGAEYEFVLFPVQSSVTLNQGDCLIWDQSGYAVQSLTGSANHPFGAQVGFVWFGGQVGLENGVVAPGSIWSATLSTPGIYGLWCQRAGKTLVNCATVNAQTKPLNVTAVAGQLNAPATALVGSVGFGTGVLYACPTTFTCTATVTSGSFVLTAVAFTKSFGIQKGMTISGTGIPTGSFVTDFNGNTITFSNLAGTAASATNTGVTVTVSQAQSYCTTTNGSPVLTNVTSIAGIYPNATLTGTGIGGAGSAQVVSITGTAAPYTITMNANSSANGSAISIVPSVYIEAFANWPTVAVQN